MKKMVILAFTAALFGVAQDAQAQSSFYSTPYKSRNSGSFEKGAHLLSFGWGAPNVAANSINSWGNRRIGFGPAYAKYEYGIMSEISLGVRLGVASGHYRYNDLKANNFAIGASFLGYYHFNKLIPVKQLDVYVGAGLGFRHLASERIVGNRNVVTDNSFTPMPVGVAGARWYFTPSFGVYAEAGYDGLSSANIGIALKF